VFKNKLLLQFSLILDSSKILQFHVQDFISNLMVKHKILFCQNQSNGHITFSAESLHRDWPVEWTCDVLVDL